MGKKKPAWNDINERIHKFKDMMQKAAELEKASREFRAMCFEEITAIYKSINKHL